MLTLHAPILETRRLHWHGEADCQAWAEQLAARPELRDAFISLQGPLGAGKTTLVRHLLRALGVAGRIKSPTYAVLEPHQVGDLAISHFDFYRFDDPREWLDAGFRDLFAQPGLKLAEWPEKAEGMLPQPDLAIILQPGHVDDADAQEDSRRVTLCASTVVGRALLA